MIAPAITESEIIGDPVQPVDQAGSQVRELPATPPRRRCRPRLAPEPTNATRPADPSISQALQPRSRHRYLPARTQVASLPCRSTLLASGITSRNQLRPHGRIAGYPPAARVASIESGRPFRPSHTMMQTSATPRLWISVRTCSPAVLGRVVISEGAVRVKDVSPEVSPLEGRVGVGGRGAVRVGCGVSVRCAVARCALHGVSPVIG